jgi:hypothetical protein
LPAIARKRDGGPGYDNPVCVGKKEIAADTAELLQLSLMKAEDADGQFVRFAESVPISMSPILLTPLLAVTMLP